MYEKVLKDYPQLRDYLNSEKEFCFNDPTQEEFELMHKVMRHFWLSIEYNCIDSEDWYFLFDSIERAERYRKEEGYIHILYNVSSMCNDKEFETYEEAKKYFEAHEPNEGDYLELQICEWYSDEYTHNTIPLMRKGVEENF